jgi:hypothetical protein
MWPWQYGVDMQPFTVIPEGKIGLVLSKDGQKFQLAAYWHAVLTATISRMRKSFWRMVASVAGKPLTLPRVLTASTVIYLTLPLQTRSSSRKIW